MIEGIPRISVTVVTYNQEDVVGRTLDSLITQKDYLYEICVSDDCSSDNTWDVLLDYQRRFPDLFKLHRQKYNVGIFENIDYAWRMPTGDIVNEIAGDDTTPDGWYKTVVEFIKKNNIDWKNELFCIYGDYKAEYPNGDSMIFRNMAIQRCPDKAFRLALRGIISQHGCCSSINIFRKFDISARGRSHKVEQVQDRQLQLYTKKNYYIPVIANIYYAGIGVSTHVEDEETYRDRLEIWPYTLRYLEKKGIVLPKVDYNYGRYNVAMKQFRHKPSFGKLLKVLCWFIASYDIHLPHGNGMKHFLFAFRRRIPHKKAIVF